MSSLQNVGQSSPRYVLARARCVEDLAEAIQAILERHPMSGQNDELTIRICFTKATSLPHPRAPSLTNSAIVVLLTLSILFRAEGFWRPNDVKCCIMYLRYLRGQCRDVLPAQYVTMSLVRAMANQVELELGDADQEIEEMTDLCDELINSDVPGESLTRPILSLMNALRSHVGALNERIPSEKLMNCLRMATVQLPDFHFPFLMLAQLYLRRLQMTFSEDDYKEGMALLDKVMNFRDPGGRPSPDLGFASSIAAHFGMIHFHVYGKPEYLEQATYRFRAFLDETHDTLEHRRPWFIRMYSGLQQWRSYHTSAKANTQDAWYSTPGSIKPTSFRDLIASLPKLKGPKSSSVLHDHSNALDLPSIDRLTDIADIEDGIEYCRQLNASYPNSAFACSTRSILPYFFWRAFKCTDEMEYLNKAISAARDHSTNTTDGLMSQTSSVGQLIIYLSTRLGVLGFGPYYREDLNELMQLYPMAAKYQSPYLDVRDLFSFEWASTARRFGHPSALTAYDMAMKSMQFYLTVTPTLDKQHSQLVVKNDYFRSLPLDFASYQMSIGQPKQAIETLERGRALLWSEMRGLRTTVDQIPSADRHLAEKFAAVSRDLETLTLALDNVGGGNSVPKGMDTLGHLVIRQKKLLDEREKLILKIQALPGLDTFMKPHSYDTLRGAACHGPVIIINHSEWGSNIVILLRNSSPSLITTPDDFYDRANKLQDRLLRARRQPEDLESNKYNDAPSSVLKELYELVGQPVIERLNKLNVPLQSRIWWCPTSVFCSLPLHAMGPIPSDWGRPQYFLDLYISSYTPSLLSLIESRKSGSQTFDKPSMLVVAQPDVTMIQALKEVRVVKAVNPRVTTLVAAAATPPAVLERIQDHRFVHIVSHGILEPGKPLDSGFELYKKQRLSLLDVVRSRLPSAEFAFLAACHTAELTDGSPTDEVLHLAAAMQFCGFRSVVGTMWAMADLDGPALAGDFYKSVFSEREQEGVYYYERTAEALRDAVVKLRRKRGVTLERWVNYVHFGA